MLGGWASHSTGPLGAPRPLTVGVDSTHAEPIHMSNPTLTPTQTTK